MFNKNGSNNGHGSANGVHKDTAVVARNGNGHKPDAAIVSEHLFGERHFPLYAPIIEFWTEAEDEPPWSWLRRGIPFDLMGFGYDGLHEMWNGYREGLSAMALLVRPPDAYYDGPDGLRVAWLESVPVLSRASMSSVLPTALKDEL